MISIAYRVLTFFSIRSFGQTLPKCPSRFLRCYTGP